MSENGEEAAAAMPPPLQRVSELTSAKIRSFLYEVAEGVSDYRSLHSLTQQVEHQYHGRFLIELVQNAHDALPEHVDPSRPCRIAVVLDLNDATPYGSLLIANDGQPFTSSNFERLSQLGQSDKDPQKSIGNKGLGFRSVLEVSERPEVYSRATSGSERFDGYCFAFEPEVVQSLIEPMEALASGAEIPLSPVSGAPIVDWSESLLRKFRARVGDAGPDWLRAETKYLSPYLLPVPRREIGSPAVRALEALGFATVVRLPLKSLTAVKLAQQHIQQLSSSTLLFLERVSALELTVIGGERKVFTRSVRQVAGRRSVLIHDSADGAREYAVWTRELHVASAPPAFRNAVAALPGRWPEIQDVSVSIAVRLGDKPEPGVFSIYLPTKVSTGSAVHVSAPFYGDMSRTEIPFDNEYNKHLLRTSAELTAEVVRKHLAGKGPEEARMIVDMICPLGNDPGASTRWCQWLIHAIEGGGGSIDGEPLILAEAGWRPLDATSLVPDTSKTSLLTDRVIRKNATFDIFHACLNSRRTQLIALANARFPGTGAYPITSDVAATVASVARELHASGGGNWNAYWTDVSMLLPNGQKELAKHKVILGGDGQLHAGADLPLFFIPRQGTPDDSDGSGASDVPSSLQSSIAFLNEAISVYEPGRQNVQTPVRTYLSDGGLVSQFRVEVILTGVLRKATPALPVPLEGPDAERCRDILVWSLRLMRNVVARGRGSDALLDLLKPIPVPCSAGWFPMSEASFGEGWPGTAGSTLVEYLRRLRAPGSNDAAGRVLLPPDHAAWGDVGLTAQDLLVKGGVFDGLRLQVLRPEDWTSAFHASSTEFALPPIGPPAISPDFWSEYRKAAGGQIRISYVTQQPYGVGPVNTFPGMTQPDLPEEARTAMCQLILHSVSRWPKGWENQAFSKRTGYADNRRGISPLWHFLRTRPWIAIPSSKGTTTWSRPIEHWHVPADLVYRRASHYAHLPALPYELAKQLDTQDSLAGVMHSLGMSYLDVHSETEDPRLITALTAAIGRDGAPADNVLLGQIRDLAWHTFRPAQNQARLPHLPVRGENRQLLAVSPSDSNRVYLPDLGTLASDLEQFGLHVIAIHPVDAKYLREWFASAYSSDVIPTSQLKLVPHVGGNPWSDSAAIPLAESELAWLVAPLLALVAFHGQNRGVHSPTFQEKLVLLKEARIQWVSEAEMVVMNDGEELIRTAVLAHWDASHKTLLMTEECRRQPAQLSLALSQALGRDDLELPLTYLLEGSRAIDEPPASLTSTLSKLRVSEEQMNLVQEHLRGDTGHAARLIQVLCSVLVPGAEPPDLSAAESDAPLAAAIKALGLAETDAQRILELARESLDLRDFGASVASILGERAALPRWNDVLEKLGAPLLTNRDWKQELLAHLDEARGLIKRVIAHIVRKNDSARSYTAMLAEFAHLPQDGTDLSGTHWEVDFHSSMRVAAELVATWGNDELATSLRGATAVEDLRQRLLSLGVDVESDPDERCRLNYQLVAKVIDAIERLRHAWAMKFHPANLGMQEQSERDRNAAALKDRLGNRAFVEIVNEEQVFASLRELKPYSDQEVFGHALADAIDLASLQTVLQITDADLTGADERLAAQRVEAQRRQHMVPICGDEFDASEENRRQLWQFLKDRVKFEEVASTTPLDLTKTVALLPIRPLGRRDRLPVDRKPSSKKTPRQPKSVDEVIGLAGEIVVFEMLRRKYGTDVITASSWVSENSRHCFEGNHVNDSMGCDFAFTVRGRAYRVEVKATAGEDETLSLGSSEIALAMELATSKRRRRGRFILVHVRKALSPTPDVVILPNPYEASSAGVFTIEDAEARVRYKTR